MIRPVIDWNILKQYHSRSPRSQWASPLSSFSSWGSWGCWTIPLALCLQKSLMRGNPCLASNHLALGSSTLSTGGLRGHDQHIAWVAAHNGTWRDMKKHVETWDTPNSGYSHPESSQKQDARRETWPDMTRHIKSFMRRHMKRHTQTRMPTRVPFTGKPVKRKTVRGNVRWIGSTQKQCAPPRVLVQSVEFICSCSFLSSYFDPAASS